MSGMRKDGDLFTAGSSEAYGGLDEKPGGGGKQQAYDTTNGRFIGDGNNTSDKTITTIRKYPTTERDVAEYKGLQPIKEFQSGKQANEYFYKEESCWLTKLTSDEKNSLHNYSVDEYYDINKYLRGDTLAHKPNMRTIENIDRAISEFSLNESIRVYRAVDLAKENSGIYPQKEQIVEWKGFTSTSVDYNAVNGDAYSMYVIDVPAGKGRGAYVNSLSEYKNAEYEFLLKRGTKARILDVYQRDGKQFVKLEVLE